MFFKAEIPIGAVRVLIAEAPRDITGVRTVGAALYTLSCLNAFRGEDVPAPFGTAPEPCAVPVFTDELCRQIEAYLPEDEEDGVPGYQAAELSPVLQFLLGKLIERVLEEAKKVLPIFG